MNIREDYLLDLGEHVYVGMNSAIIVMDVFSYHCYVGKWKKEDKLRSKKREYGIIAAQDMPQLIKLSLMFLIMKILITCCFTSWIVGQTNLLEESFGVSSMAYTVFDV